MFTYIITVNGTLVFKYIKFYENEMIATKMYFGYLNFNYFRYL